MMDIEPTPAPSLGASLAPDFRRRWEIALQDLEVDLALAEAMLAGDHLPEPERGWTPPENLGPLPAPLRQRAQLLLQRQIEVAQQLADALVHSRQHTRLVESLKMGTGAYPVYVDAEG